MAKRINKNAVEVLETGATRVPVEEHCHYICPEMELRVSRICAEGFKSYPDKDVLYAELSTGRRGLPKANLAKHARRHWALLWKGDKREDHAAKVIWALMQMMHQESGDADNPWTTGPCDHFNFLLKQEDQIHG